MDGPFPHAQSRPLEVLTAQLDAAARSIRDGGEVRPIPTGISPDADAVALAVNRLMAAMAAREEERRTATEHQHNVLLAFEELARDQARDLARQNEELRKQNEQLREVNRLKSEFVTTMSHELRTPLNAVIGFSELMLEGIPGPLTEEQTEYLEAIHRSGNGLLTLINDILDMAKVDAGRMDFQNEPFDLSAVALEAGSIARSMAMKKDQQFILDCDAPVFALGDARRVRQVALNLMSNAVKFTPRGGTVTTLTRIRDGWAELVVKDTGIGIDPAHHELVFEAFRQVDGSTTREFQGTGLGLALVRKFATAMGGTVTLDSRKGEGATFVLRLAEVKAAAVESSRELRAVQTEVQAA